MSRLVRPSVCTDAFSYTFHVKLKHREGDILFPPSLSLKMSISIVSGFIMVDEFGNVRVTDQGLISAFDLIRVVAGQKNPYQVWVRLSEVYPDVLTTCENFKFPGRGQKETPVVSKKTALKILGILPGAVGASYREAAATTLLAYLENPDQLAKAAINRIDDVDKLDDVAISLAEARNRLKGIESRKSYTSVIQEQGKHEYWRATDEVYDSMLGLRAKDIKFIATGNIKAKGSARGYLKDSAIAMLETIESLAASVALDSGEDVLELAKLCAYQSTNQLDPRFKAKLTEFREKPLSPDNARKVAGS